MDYYIVIILATFAGFMALAAALLVPVYRFLKREEDVDRQWTDVTVAARARATRSGPADSPASPQFSSPRESDSDRSGAKGSSASRES